MSNRLKMTPAKQFNAARFNDPKSMNAYTMQRYGMSAADVEQALKLNAALAAGRMPDTEQFKWVCNAAKDKYGWSSDRVRSELNQCLQHPTPEGRITAYLHAGGNQVAPEMVREVIGLVESYAHADMEQTVLDRLSQSPGEQYFNKRENNLPVNQRAKDFADGRTDIRNTLKQQLQDSAAVTYGEARQRVHRAGLRLVDRINASEAQDMLDRANGREPQG